MASVCTESSDGTVFSISNRRRCKCVRVPASYCELTTSSRSLIPPYLPSASFPFPPRKPQCFEGFAINLQFHLIGIYDSWATSVTGTTKQVRSTIFSMSFVDSSMSLWSFHHTPTDPAHRHMHFCRKFAFKSNRIKDFLSLFNFFPPSCLV